MRVRIYEMDPYEAMQLVNGDASFRPMTWPDDAVIVDYRLQVRFDKHASWVKVRSEAFEPVPVGANIPIYTCGVI
jgi:hypothetical protein